jgi:hypothetical protein
LALRLIAGPPVEDLHSPNRLFAHGFMTAIHRDGGYHLNG